MNKQAKKSMLIALFISLAVCIAGAIIWGLMYQLGVFSTLVSAISAVLALLAYRKFYKLNWIAYLWVILWSILLNELAMLIVEAIIATNELNVNFSEGFSIICNLIATNSDAKSIFVSNSIWSVAFTLLGAILTIISLRNQEKKNQLNQQILQDAENQRVYSLDEKFTIALSSFKTIIDAYNMDKNKEKFKTSSEKLVNGILSNLDLLEKEQIRLKIKEMLIDPSTSSKDKKALAIMEKMI